MKKKTKKRKKGKKRTIKIRRKEKDNSLLFVLILLVIIVSIFSTLIILNSVDNAKKFFIEQQTYTPGETGKVQLNVLPNLNNYMPPATGETVISKIGIEIFPQE